MNQFRLYCLFFLGMLIINGYTQTATNYNYRSPMDITLFLSGTFGELRSDHFHSGLDFRTGGVEGHPVYAIADGFVSRIAVSPVGFGKTIYISHPSTGHMSVYAHLQRFNTELAAYVKQEQYKAESFQVNLFPEPPMFPVKRGQLIGYAGNSGSSGGPHLHFEIRDAASQHVLNPLAFGFKVRDIIRPTITRLAVYPESAASAVQSKNAASFYEVQGWGEQHRVKDHEKIRASGLISFGISTYDTGNDTPHKNGVYSIRLLIDSLLVFGFRADRFSFDETRYINSMIDYAFLQRNQSRIVRTKVDPFNRLSLYDGMKGNGTFTIDEGKIYQAVYEVKDFYGNTSLLRFTIVGEKAPSFAAVADTGDNTQLAFGGRAFNTKGEGFELSIPANALYRDESISFSAVASRDFLSDLINTGSGDIPLHTSAELRIKPKTTLVPLNKMIIARIEKGKAPAALDTKVTGNSLSTSIRRLGSFAVLADTVNPVIRPLNFGRNTVVDTLKTLRINVIDSLSGIQRIRAELNGKWLLMDYDAKNNLLFYEIDERMLKGENHFVLTVTDKVGNAARFEAKLSKN